MDGLQSRHTCFEGEGSFTEPQFKIARSTLFAFLAHLATLRDVTALRHGTQRRPGCKENAREDYTYIPAEYEKALPEVFAKRRLEELHGCPVSNFYFLTN
jgi:hypothetical protein